MGWQIKLVEPGHQAEIHVQLLVAGKERQTGMVSDKVDFHFLVATDHYDVFITPA